MLYHFYELNQAALRPARAAADAYRLLVRNPLNPAYHPPLGRSAEAALELFERTTRRYRKPLSMGISPTSGPSWHSWIWGCRPSHWRKPSPIRAFVANGWAPPC